MKIEYVDGVPRWFTWLLHKWTYYTHCKRRGHTLTAWQSCNRCGGYPGT